MKLPKLPAECIRRLFAKTGQSSLTAKFSGSDIPKTIGAMVLGLSNSEPYTIEELDKLGILTTIIDATMYTCNEYDLTKEALEFFDEIKSNYKALDYFIERMPKLAQNLLKDQNFARHILDTLIGPELGKLKILPTIIDAAMYTYNEYNLTKEALEFFDKIKSSYKALDYFIERMPKLGKKLLKDPGVKQHILDTLIGPEWKEPDFYLYDDASLRLIDKSLRRKKNISSILCDGLCIFDDIPKDRLNKFYDALRRLKPYFKRRGFRYTIDKTLRISYKSKDFPISMPKLILRQPTIDLEWHIENNQLIIEKIFRVYDYYKYIRRNELKDFINRLKEKYPKQMQKADIDPGADVCPLSWEHSRKYNLPDDLRGLNNM